ncbi:MAG TPA: hypothetical protein V6C76_11575 [Drouetiella sp.]
MNISEKLKTDIENVMYQSNMMLLGSAGIQHQSEELQTKFIRQTKATTRALIDLIEAEAKGNVPTGCYSGD